MTAASWPPDLTGDSAVIIAVAALAWYSFKLNTVVDKSSNKPARKRLFTLPSRNTVNTNTSNRDAIGPAALTSIGITILRLKRRAFRKANLNDATLAAYDYSHFADAACLA